MSILSISKAPEKLKGSIRLPASKSISNRALIIQALCAHPFPINNLSIADDTLLLQQILAEKECELYIKNAGTAMRFLTAYYACHEDEIVLRGSERMNERPISPLVEALRRLGADIEYLGNDGFPPLFIRGQRLRGGYLEVDASQSSQFASALLLIAPVMEDGLTLCLTGDAVSVPYIQLTLDVMQQFGISFERRDNTILVPPQAYQPRNYFVESDWSAASYFWALAALFPGSELQFPFLFRESSQGDSILKSLMKPFGVAYEFDHYGCNITSVPDRPSLFDFDFIDHPDLVPTFVSLCTTAGVPFHISGTRTLQYKESNRALALQEELGKLGYNIARTENALLMCTAKAPSLPSTLLLNTYEDHRMAMSFTLPASQYPSISIESPEVVEKSFPNFWTELEKLGFKLTYQPER